MKRMGSWILGMLLCASLFTVIGYYLSESKTLWRPGRIVPAAVLLPRDWRAERERRWFDSLMGARPGLLDSARKFLNK